MADAQRPDTAQWNCTPETELRRMKTSVEQEMMIKLGAIKETIEFHPLILTQRAERAKTSFQLDYRRVKPPYQEKQPPNRDPWISTNQAARQLAHPRQGPRKLSLPAVSHYKAVKRVVVPLEDEEYKKLSMAQTQSSHVITISQKCYNSKAAVQYTAYAIRRVSHLSLPDIDPLRRYSSATLFSNRSPSPTERTALGAGGATAGSRRTKKPRKVVVPFTNVPPTGKPRSRWRGMARQLLWNKKGAQMLLPEEVPKSEVRIYVSCTEDLSEEREFLAEVAYPELKKYCEKQGLSCHVVDLRHGTGRLKNDRETFDVIEREVAQCLKHSIGPCFVSLVGCEADDRELPGWLTTEDMMAVRSVMVKSELDLAVETLDNLYRLDSNYQPPLYLLQDSYVFAETEETEILHNALPDILTQLRLEGKLAEDEPGYYSWSSAVKEIQTGLLSIPEPKRHTVCLMARADGTKPRTPKTPKSRTKHKPKSTASNASSENNEETKTTKADKSNRRASSALSGVSRDSSVPSEYTNPTGDDSADKLRADIVDYYNRAGNKQNLVLFNVSKKTLSYLREVCTLFLSAVTSVVERQMTHYEFDVSHHLTHAADVVQHVAVARKTCAGFVGGELALRTVPEMLKSKAGKGKVKPVVVVGPEGAGKTALTSLLAVSLPRADPLRRVVFRIMDLTLGSSSLLHAVTSLYHQVCFLYDQQPCLAADVTLKGTLHAFRGLLHDVQDLAQQRPLTIVLEGVDRVPDMLPKHFGFLVGSLPPGVTLVMSMLNAGPLYDAVKATTDDVEFVYCPTFSSEQLGTYVKEFLTGRNKTVTKDQFRAVLRELSKRNVPLVAEVAGSVVCRWPSHTMNDSLDISSDMDSAFHRLAESCEVQLGKTFTGYVLSMLVASRFGLADFEILHIISADSDLLDEIVEETDDLLLEGYPFQIQISRLIGRIAPFLYEVKTEGESLLKVSHDVMRTVVQTRYLSGDFKHRIHSHLATFFRFTRRGNLLSSRDIVEGKHKDLSHYLWRTLRSVPYHLCHSLPDPAEAWKKLKSETFMNFVWIINDIYAGFFNDLIEDVNYSLETLGLDSEVLFMRQFLIGIRQSVIFNPVSLASQLAGQDVREMKQMQQSVAEAKDWLKQVHLQVLVPAAYTAPKPSQLQLNAALAEEVRVLVADKSGERVVVQHETHLTSLDHRTGEETTLVRLTNAIVSTHLWGPAMLTVATKSAIAGKLSLDTYALDRGRHVKSTLLKDSPVVWLHVREEGVAYYASKRIVRKVDLEKGKVSDVYETEETMVAAAMADNKYRVVSLHASPKALLHVFDSRVPTAVGTVYVGKALAPDPLQPLLTVTKDCVYAVVLCDSELAVADVGAERMMYTIGFNNVQVTATAFSRSYEHVFVATPTGVIRAFKLLSGAEVMTASIGCSQQRPSSDSPRGRSSASPGRSRNRAANTPSPARQQRGARNQIQNNDDADQQAPELVTTMLTSEDDHFLLAGTSRGRLHVHHVPTGLEVCVLHCHGGQQDGSSGLRQMLYFTNVSWFQSVATLDNAGLVKLWNVQPVLSAARGLIMGIIKDEDLTKEEEAKLDLADYFSLFKERRNDRIFLNGPDISAFYRKPAKGDLFAPVKALDPMLQSPQPWAVTGRLGDCTDIAVLSAGSVLSEVLVTATTQGDVARWSLADGKLVSLRSCPLALDDGAVVESVRSVYYDQAACLVLKGETGRKTVAVQFADDKKRQPLVLEDTVVGHVSTDGSLVAQVCCHQQAELIVVYWNLKSGEEQTRVVLSKLAAFSKHASALTFSGDLKVCALLIPTAKDSCSLHVWTIDVDLNCGEEQQKEGEAEDADKEKTDLIPPTTSETLLAQSEQSSSPTPSSSDQKNFADFVYKKLDLPVMPTAITLAHCDAVLLGTSSGLTLLVSLKTMSLTSALTSEGVQPTLNQPLLSTAPWDHHSPAHTSGVKKLTSATGSHVVTSSCGQTLCVWSLLSKRLLFRVSLQSEEFLFYVLSRDSRVLTYVTSDGTLAVWGVKKGKQLCDFRIQRPVTALALTPDNSKVLVLQAESVTSGVRVFDVRNIDDIKVDESHDKVAKDGHDSDDQGDADTTR